MDNRLRDEVGRYSEQLAAKEHVVLLTKRDVLADAPPPSLKAPDAVGVLAISSASGDGIEELKEYLWKLVQGAKLVETAETVTPWEEEDSVP